MGARSTGSHPTTTKADGHLLEYFRQSFGAGGGGTNQAFPTGMSATGGVISEYVDPSTSKIYRAHIFSTSGTIDFTAGGDLGDTVDYLLVGGGGGAGACNGGGGGAGEVLFKTGVATPGSFPAPFPVVVGGGGAGQAAGSHNNPRHDGVATTFGLGSVGAAGGGAGGTGQDPGPNAPGDAGGSGGGGGTNSVLVEQEVVFYIQDQDH
tara:strand:- start:34 stop:654 length:621 start_codon:yes stop_codon:yes gene_type:complete